MEIVIVGLILVPLVVGFAWAAVQAYKTWKSPKSPHGGGSGGSNGGNTSHEL